MSDEISIPPNLPVVQESIEPVKKKAGRPFGSFSKEKVKPINWDGRNTEEICRDLCNDPSNPSNPINYFMWAVNLKEGVIGGKYSNIKIADISKAAEIVLHYGIGKPKDTVEIIQKNPFDGMSDEQVINNLIDLLGVEIVAYHCLRRDKKEVERMIKNWVDDKPKAIDVKPDVKPT